MLTAQHSLVSVRVLLLSLVVLTKLPSCPSRRLAVSLLLLMLPPLLMMISFHIVYTHKPVEADAKNRINMKTNLI